MPDLSKMPPAELKAAMQGGTEAWGQWGSAADHVRYTRELPASARRRCTCGCKRRRTHAGMANGVALTSGCELSVARWVKDPFWDIRRQRPAEAALRDADRQEGSE